MASLYNKFLDFIGIEESDEPDDEYMDEYRDDYQEDYRDRNSSRSNNSRYRNDYDDRSGRNSSRYLRDDPPHSGAWFSRATRSISSIFSITHAGVSQRYTVKPENLSMVVSSRPRSASSSTTRISIFLFMQELRIYKMFTR